MDCRKPLGAYKDSIIPELVEDGYKLVQICTNDGYTRMDNKCGCFGCYCWILYICIGKNKINIKNTNLT